MRLIKLHARMFRNIDDTTISFGPRFNIFHGDNAQGKTNLLEAIFLLGTIKSFRMAKNVDLINWSDSTGLLRGWVDRDGVTREISLLLEKHGKKVTIDRKSVSRLSDFFGNLNVVIFSPEEMGMVRGTPEVRRRYLDRAVFSSDLTYLRLYHEYGKILKNRNTLLRTGATASLDVWTEQLAEAGSRMMNSRLQYLESINPLLTGFYGEIAGKPEQVEIRYRPHALRGEMGEAGTRERLLETLQAHAAEERRRGTTLAGPHRDDLDFVLDGKLLKHHASQGQQRSFILALKMAEIEYLRNRYMVPPVLLLDDMTSELDPNRNRNLMSFLDKRNMQVFITTTNLQNIMLDDIDHYPAFRIEAGKVVHEGNK